MSSLVINYEKMCIIVSIWVLFFVNKRLLYLEIQLKFIDETHFFNLFKDEVNLVRSTEAKKKLT